MNWAFQGEKEIIKKVKFGEIEVGKVETSFVQPPFLNSLCVFFGVRNLRVGNFVVGGSCVGWELRKG